MSTVAFRPVVAYLRGSSARRRDEDKGAPSGPAAAGTSTLQRALAAPLAETAETAETAEATEATEALRSRRLIEAWTRSAGEHLMRRSALAEGRRRRH